jgi:hypothetical protein
VRDGRRIRGLTLEICREKLAWLESELQMMSTGQTRYYASRFNRLEENRAWFAQRLAERLPRQPISTQEESYHEDQTLRETL